MQGSPGYLSGLFGLDPHVTLAHLFVADKVISQNGEFELELQGFNAKLLKDSVKVMQTSCSMLPILAQL
jgi:hypothetical protein